MTTRDVSDRTYIFCAHSRRPWTSPAKLKDESAWKPRLLLQQPQQRFGISGSVMSKIYIHVASFRQQIGFKTLQMVQSMTKCRSENHWTGASHACNDVISSLLTVGDVHVRCIHAVEILTVTTQRSVQTRTGRGFNIFLPAWALTVHTQLNSCCCQ